MCFGLCRSLLRDVLNCHFCSTFIYSWRGNVEIVPSELKASSTNVSTKFGAKDHSAADRHINISVPLRA